VSVVYDVTLYPLMADQKDQREIALVSLHGTQTLLSEAGIVIAGAGGKRNG
jgi:hypothetical protein